MSTADLTDDQLGRRALAGDREAFTDLFARHESGLFNVAHRLTGDREDAADITQEAFLRVFARLDDLAGREVNLAAYLYRTARNLVYDRTARRSRETPTDALDQLAGPDETAEADPQLSALIAAQGSDVRAANARLPERHRLALALRELEDMSYEDIGRVLDVTPGAVAQLLVRARLALRRELRMGQVDVEAMDPACRARLGEIGALIDGELGPDRAHVLSQHLALCPACRAARASFEQARVTYRAWLPLPVLALGASTARAAEGRGLVRFGDSARQGAGLGAGVGGFLAGRHRAGAMVGSGLLGVILLFGAPTLVAIRSGSSPPPPVAPLARTPATVTTTTTPARATTASVPATTTTAPAAVAPPAAPASQPESPVDVAATAPAPVTVGRPRTTRAAPPAPPVRVVTPTVTSAGAPDPPPPTTTAAPAVDPPPPATTDAPPTTTVAPPTTTTEPPPTTTTRTDNPPGGVF